MNLLWRAQLKVDRIKSTIKHYEDALRRAREKLMEAEAHVEYVRRRYKCFHSPEAKK
jgi:hypothetical protein